MLPMHYPWPDINPERASHHHHHRKSRPVQMPPHPSELSAPPPSKPSTAAAAASSMGAPSYSLHLIGDYIGVESCVVDYEEPPDPGASAAAAADGGGDSLLRAEPERGRRRRREPKGRRREYPPPIPLLARTGNLHSHMPWVLRRHYTSDGRLVLTEEKVRHHEYFRARRANGRLTLQLVPLDGDAPYLPMIADDDNDEEGEEEEEEAEEGEVLNPEAAGITIAGDLDNGDGGDGDDDDCQGEPGDRGGGGEEEEDRAKLASSIAELTVESGGGGGMGGSNGAGKCSNYTGISVSPSSSCIFGLPVPVPALRPVHS